MKQLNRYIFTTIIVMSITSLLSCKHSQDEVKDNEITFDTLRVSDNYHLYNDSTMPSSNLQLTFIYPESYGNNEGQKSPILDSLQNIFLASFLEPSYTIFRSNANQALEKYKEDYRASYLHDIEVFYTNKTSDHDNNDKFLSYYETIQNKIIFNQKNILSFQVSQNIYKGGASSYLLLKNYSVDLNTGNIIFDDDIFNPGFEATLSKIFKDHLLRVNELKEINDLENLGYFGIDEIIPNENLLIDDRGITYIFNKGEYSTYKLDPITIFIPYKDISFLLKEDSPISQFLEN